MKSLIAFLMVGVVALYMAQVVSAAGLAVTKIGTSTTPATFTQWTYSGLNPVFEGTALADADVEIKINETTFTAKANDVGVWTFTPTTLSSAATYPIVITSENETKSFSLTITSTSSAAATSSATGSTTSATTKGGVDYPDELPQTGATSTAIALVLGGLTFIGAGTFLYWRLIPHLVFETRSQPEGE